MTDLAGSQRTTNPKGRSRAAAACRWAPLLLSACCMLFHAPAAPGEEVIHVAQSRRGAGTGADSASARSVVWFNSPHHWGDGAGRIGRGTTVRFHGTIATSVDVQGNGSRSRPIILDFSDSILNAPDEIQIELNGHDHISVVNATFSETVTSGSLIHLGGYSENITISGCRYQGPALSTVTAILHQCGSNTTIEGNTFVNVSCGVRGDRIHNHDIAIRDNTFVGSTRGEEQDIIKFGDAYNVLIEGNHLVIRKANSADNPRDDSHVDGIQSYKKGGSDAGYPYNWTISRNTIELDSDNPHHRSWTMLEGMTGRLNIVSNVFIGTRGGLSANGLNVNGGRSGLRAHIYNNTFVAKEGPNHIIAVRGDGRFDFKNNIVYSMKPGGTVVKSPLPESLERSNNLYFGGGLFAGLNAQDWAAAETGSLLNVDPLFADLDADDYRLQRGSPAIDAGAPVDVAKDRDGTVRPQGNAYDIGAFESAAADE